MTLKEDVEHYLSYAEPRYERAAVELGPAAVPLFRSAFDSGSQSLDAPQVLLARRAVYFVAMIAHQFPEVVEAAARLASDAMNDRNYRLRLAGGAAAVVIGGQARVDALNKCLADPHLAVQAWAVDQVSHAPDDNRSTIQATEEALKQIANGRNTELAAMAAAVLGLDS